MQAFAYRAAELWHQTLKSRIPLENRNRFMSGALKAAVGEFAEHCKHSRVQKHLGNVATANVHVGRAEAVLAKHRRIKVETIRQRRSLHRCRAA